MIPILVVDDDAGGRYVTTHVLRRAGFRVREAETGGEALRLVAEHPDLVLLDVHLPGGLTGFDVCRRLKTDPATADIPVLHLSAQYVRSEDRVRGLEGGADGYLTMPIEPAELVAHVNAMLRVHHAERAQRRAHEKLTRLQTLAAALAQAVTSEQVADVIIDRGLAALGASAGMVAVLDGDEFTALRVVGYPPEAAEAWRRFPLDAPLPAAAVRTRQPVILETWHERLARFPEVAARGLAGALAVLPMIVLGRVVGALRWDFPADRTFDEQDRAFLLALAEICGQALERTRLYEAERQARERAEQALEERRRAEQNLRFLAEAGTTLADLVDVETALANVARLAIPFFADWCVVDLVDDDGNIQRVACAHADPAKELLVRELSRQHAVDWDSPLLLVRVLKTGAPALVPEVTDDLLREVALDADYLRRLRELGPRSFVCVPLVARDAVFGAIGFVLSRPARHYGADDLALAREIARRAAAAIDNARLYRAAREADRHKDHFLALLAHELRNPLAPLRNALQLLRIRGLRPPELEQMRAMMERQVQQLVRLVDDLLDLSRIARGKIGLKKERVQLADVVHQAVETSRPLIDAHGHQLTITVPAEPIWLEGDSVRLAQVIGNLLNNAAKYSERGGRIWLTAECAAGEAVLRVKDTGIGISADMLPRVFEPFAQAERARGRSQGGLGLGLTLVRTLVDLHGGGVTAHSDGPGKGSVFVVRLPVVTDCPGAEAARPEAEPPADDAPPRRVLVVDDLADAADSLATLLRRWGSDVRVARTGLEALAAAEFRPEVVFLDLGLPDLSGYEVIERMRQLSGLGEAVIVAMTGYGQDEDRRRSREAGFDHHLVKPIEPEELRRLLASPHAAHPAT